MRHAGSTAELDVAVAQLSGMAVLDTAPSLGWQRRLRRVSRYDVPGNHLREELAP